MNLAVHTPKSHSYTSVVKDDTFDYFSVILRSLLVYNKNLLKLKLQHANKNKQKKKRKSK